MDWYSLRVISGKEKVAEGNIYLEAKEQGIENDIESVFIPSEKVVRMKNNKKVITGGKEKWLEQTMKDKEMSNKLIC